MVWPPPESPDPTLRHALRHVSRAFHSQFRERLAEFEVSEAAYQSMFALRRIPNMSSADLARWTGVTAQSANQILKGLIEAGLVERRPAEDHGRILEARLTARGEEVIEACERAGDELEVTMASQMTADELVQLEALLRKAADGLGVPIAQRRGVRAPAGAQRSL